MSEPPPGSRISLRDIGKKLNLSHSTISLALRNHPRISAPVREKIHALAKEMGYRPDPMLAALAHYRNNRGGAPVRAAMAWINCWEPPEDLRKHREFDLYWRGAASVAEKFGYHVEEFAVGSRGISPQRLEKVLLTRGIQGILLAPLPPNYSLQAWEDFKWEHFSIVRFGRSWSTPHAHAVTSDQVSNTIRAVESMRERGYRRIGFVTGSRSLPWSLYKAGFLVVQSEMEEKLRIPALVLPETDSMEPMVAELTSWMKKHRPDAILTDVAAMREMLKQVGYKVPEDVGLAVESVLDGNADTGIDQNAEEIGRVAFLMAISLINDNARGIPKIFRKSLVSGNWVDGSMLPRRDG